MTLRPSALVSIVTPVYNNAEHLPECIESVLAQTYQDWEYIIVNNCCTDGSAEIARRYAERDPRIRVHDNRQFLRVIPNHNHALRQISSKSKYCKVVFGDDWIYPRCLEEMVAIAEENPSVGIVSSYALWEVLSPGPPKYVAMLGGLPYPSGPVSGTDVCRRTFLEGISVFGTATSHLYRSDLVRSRDPFYNESNFHADRESCIESLKTWDFGFVHQILTFTRGRQESLSTMAVDMQMKFGCDLHTLTTHGPDLLTREELDGCLDELLNEYYNFLAVSFMRGRRDKKFWEYHKLKLNETVGFSSVKLGRAIAARLCRALLNPYETFAKLGNSRTGRKTYTANTTREPRAAHRASTRPSEGLTR
jgi:glycosyltransferase involved in cell wall biosynthesis